DGTSDAREPEALQRSALPGARADGAATQGHAQHPIAPGGVPAHCCSSARLLPLSEATSPGCFSSRSACMVARTMLCGLLEPMHLVSTSAMPASSTPARTPPPAITPVPMDAGFSSTTPAPKRPVTSYGIVPAAIGTGIIDFFAFSMPLRIASGTSLALPRPKPTRPLPSPTTTSALKLNRRPPFTTFATRLMWTTFSFSSAPRSPTIRLGLLEPVCAMSRLPSELEAAFARAVRDGAYAAVIQEAIAIEHHPLDALLLAAASGEQPHLLGGAHVGGLRQLRPQLGGERRHRQARPARLLG